MSKSTNGARAEAIDEAGAPCRHVKCVVCANKPCTCPKFGTPEYFALIDKRHGR